ncbi:insulin-like growth factor-binding protein complex acid labile subunit [Plutella xylostella]|uniref:insulin-like growth factor-binding protein complex acid labile subunit n=1 Tax=Plutella xylostella TaxID=51655 RepID=UPI0020323838|nr:insulin-like growth factor-binding protein complex acid labile subunit [Plutella xylostella]
MCRGSEICKVLALLAAVAVAAAAAGGSECASSVDALNTATLNCSRRHIDVLPENWPQEILDVPADQHVLITFFNNSLTRVTQLPAAPGARVAVSFKNNTIRDVDDDAFRNMPNLVYLDLSNNAITGEVLRGEIFQGPYQDGVYDSIALETLNLGYNQIHSLDRNLFEYTPNLTRLYLNNNPIEILDHVTILALATATNLEVLDLAYTDIDSIPLDAFRGLERLQQVDLSGNKFLEVPESLSLVGSSLEYLNFNNNPIVELNDDSFIGLTNLKELEVGENEYLEEVKRSTFSPLKSLRVLHLCHNRKLSYISHNAFRGLKDAWTLKEVYLDDNNLSELPSDLMPWSKLDTIGMTGNNWLCNCDLANIVIAQGAARKFKTGDIPYCVAPMRWSGAYITNVTLDYCPTFDNTFTPKQKKSFGIRDLKPKHVLWSIFGVAMIVLVGMVIGLLVNTVKAFYKKTFRSQPIHYININDDSSFA